MSTNLVKSLGKEHIIVKESKYFEFSHVYVKGTNSPTMLLSVSGFKIRVFTTQNTYSTSRVKLAMP